jgi:hypothetical protein
VYDPSQFSAVVIGTAEQEKIYLKQANFKGTEFKVST